MFYRLELELKVPCILGQLAGEDHTRNKEQQRRHQNKAADDERGETGHQTGMEIIIQHRNHKADPKHRQHGCNRAEEGKGTIVFEQTNDGPQYFETVGVGIELTLGPFGAIRYSMITLSTCMLRCRA